MTYLHNFIVPFLLILVISLCEFSTAIYTPSLSLMACHFHITEAMVQWTVSLNLLGLSLSGLFYGPLSDAYGRRRIMCGGMGIFLVGSFFSWATSSFETLLFFRFIQGLGAGVSVVVGFAIIRDLFNQQKSAAVLSYMGMAIALSPGIAPILGGYLSYLYGWKSCFAIILMSSTFIFLFIIFYMPETLPREKRTVFSYKTSKLAYTKVLKNKEFVLFSLILSLMIGGIWVWMASSPLLFISYLGVPLPSFGYYGFTGILFYMLGAFINTKAVHHFSLKSLLGFGLIACLASSFALITAGLFTLKSPLLLQGIELGFAFGVSFILPNGAALAFSYVDQEAGTSSAFLGALEMAVGSFAIFLGGQLFEGTITSIASLMFIGTALSLGCYVYLFYFSAAAHPISSKKQ